MRLDNYVLGSLLRSRRGSQQMQTGSILLVLSFLKVHFRTCPSKTHQTLKVSKRRSARQAACFRNDAAKSLLSFHKSLHLLCSRAFRAMPQNRIWMKASTLLYETNAWKHPYCKGGVWEVGTWVGGKETSTTQLCASANGHGKHRFISRNHVIQNCFQQHTGM